MNTGPMKVRGVVTIRGQMFHIETGGDWGGGGEPYAVADVIEALKKMKLAALITFHETLVAQQETPLYLRTASMAAESLCDPILARHALPPEYDGAGAWLHIRAIEKEDAHMFEKGT
jgi:hypothetical protein